MSISSNKAGKSASVTIVVTIQDPAVLRQTALECYRKENRGRSASDVEKEFDEFCGQSHTTPEAQQLRLIFDRGGPFPGIEIQDSMATIED